MDKDTMDSLNEAADWFFRQDGQTLSESERARFQAWLAVPENHAAYVEIGGAWAEAGHLPRSARAGAQNRIREAGGHQLWRIAAALVLTAIGLGYAFDVPTRLQADIYTRAGELRSDTLSDGSVVQANTASALAIRFTLGERRIRLIKGEAVFTVAHDPAQPFVVEADGDSATALGTVFAVQETGHGSVVTVLESRVAVSFAEGRGTAELAPGQQARPLGSGHEVAEIDPEAATAWRRGKLMFSDRPLGDVISELNRYFAGRIQIIDPALYSRRVSGVFDTSDPLAVVSALEDSLGLASTRIGAVLVLLHR